MGPLDHRLAQRQEGPNPPYRPAQKSEPGAFFLEAQALEEAIPDPLADGFEKVRHRVGSERRRGYWVRKDT